MENKRQRKMTAKEFIKEALMGDLEKIINQRKGKYFSFCILFLAIEFLGACLDPYDWKEKGLSEKRFNNVMKLFDSKYRSLDLYNLRCGLAHVLLPSEGIELSCKEEAEDKGWEHMQKNSKRRVVLILEDLNKDFKNVCQEVIRINPSKINKDILEV